MFYVNNTDKKGLAHEQTPLERNHLRYLLQTDEEIADIMRNTHGVHVYMKLLLYAFGLFQQTLEELKDLQKSIQEFKTN